MTDHPTSSRRDLLKTAGASGLISLVASNAARAEETPRKSFRLAATFRQMLLTGKEPVPHPEILEVTAIVQATAKSLADRSRLVKLDEVMS